MRTKNRQTVAFADIAEKPVVVQFDRPEESSDGGAILLKVVDKQLALTERLADSVQDSRQAGKVSHPMAELLRERVFAIACGYPDCNDAAKLRTDPVMKLACDRAPLEGRSLASQPTLSRFENALSRADLMRMAYALTDAAIEAQARLRKKTRRITIDMDPTEDPTYGSQQMTFFNAFYDNWCYLPMVTTLQFDQESEQWLVAPVLRPGNARGSKGAIGILQRLLPRLKAAFPKAKVRVRMDGAFAAPEVLAYLEAKRLPYAINMPINSVLKRLAEPLMQQVRPLAKVSGRTERVFGETSSYKAGTWERKRRVVIKAEVAALEGRPMRDNARFVVTNMGLTPKACYRFYACRGDAENRLKELHYGLSFDRTSCTAFNANQLRNLLTAAAYILYQHLRLKAKGTDCEIAQVSTLRDRLIKIAVAVVESVRRIVFRAPLAFPWLATWRRLALVLAPSTG